MNPQTKLPSLEALTGLFLFKHSSSLFLKGLLLSLIALLIIGFSKQTYLVDSSFLLFGMVAFAFTMYSFLNKKWGQLVVGFFAALSVFSDFLFYDYTDQIKWLMILPVIAYFIVLGRRNDYEKELAILTIFAVYALSEFLHLSVFW